ncbi:DUF4150 domain-containing protein [Myxococcus llanfairpwllgwyngyllgogerychwyrndrobwllllantysiliogogogochensis]|uniref:DUF4150 domain-containing protein n=1 Tax=Myxococcus llanfairpwllgwyngyllgogerychwyrndrobwllllantysiliogogogochensis TaxID=2590453 RepID=A0A540X9K7_9BACT|nr:PAAR-like domain-containing protein [Myxococcus llanfairpwllgwyngyllgogerychwyrndrobwllllantysiliogogogochensis]TQF17947.1 DUF4150 domain-containing protein [Myxococcus llanfairpwllgwyngyllgogerychwyrndrobwllllantysiliogogogochensis]
MAKVGIHPPKTPVTEGSNGIAKATLPNVCKMPGPPAPFVPTPLPNIAKSGQSPKGFSVTVTIEGKAVAIRGATFESMGDMASKGTGGGLTSASTHGPAKFITPGSLTVKIEGKNVHLLGEPMLNNCGPNGSPPNTGATMMGLKQGELQKPKRCPPHGPEVTRERSQADEIKKQQQRVDDAKTKTHHAKGEHKAAEKALEDRLAKRTQGTPGTDALRKAVPRAAAAAESAEAYLADQERKLRALEWEKKVADECGGGKNIQLICEHCGGDMGDLDVVTNDGRVKEVKSSEAGYAEKKDKFEYYRQLVEETSILGAGMRMKLAIPGAIADAVEEKHPELKKRVQGH